MTLEFLQSIDDEALSGIWARLPASELAGTFGPVVAARASLSLKLAGVALARLAELSGSVREELLGGNSPLHASLLGRWILAEAWLTVPERADAAVALWSDILEQSPGHAAEALLGRARAYRAGGDLTRAVTDIAELARRTGDYGTLSKAARLLDRLCVRGPSLPGRKVRVGIVSSSSTELWPSLLRLLGLRDGLAIESYCAPFGSYRQELLDPRSGLHAFAPDFVIIAIHWRDAALAPVNNDPAAADRLVREFQQLWAAAQQVAPCTVLQHTFDFPIHDSSGYLSVHARGRRGILGEINRRMLAAEAHGVVFVECDRIAATVGAERWADDALWHVAKQHPAALALPQLIDRYVRLMAARLGYAKKVAVFDLDNTLWGGVVGEDGPHGIKVGPPSAVGEAHAALQRYARELKQRGVLLAVCSKNNEADAREPFRQTLGMELKEDDFVAFFANWDEKPTNLRRIAEQLNLGTDSLVFIDDNPLERAKVRRAMPEVTVVDLPADPAGFVAALDRGAYFEALALSTEDLARHESYAANAQRETLKADAGDLESFLTRLDMRMHHGSFNDAVHDRVVQLFNKTNQFNLTTRRHGSADVAAMRADPRIWTQYFRLVDCFGDNGLIGLAVARPAESEEIWEIDSFLMSCRVLGRQAEEFIVATLLTEARQRRVRVVRGRYRPTAKNAMVADLFLRLGFAPEAAGADGQTWCWDLTKRAVPTVRFVRSAGE